jgi:hypothetical protein
VGPVAFQHSDFASIQNKQYIYFSRTTEQPFSYTVINQSWFQLALNANTGFDYRQSLHGIDSFFFFWLLHIAQHEQCTLHLFLFTTASHREASKVAVAVSLIVLRTHFLLPFARTHTYASRRTHRHPQDVRSVRGVLVPHTWTPCSVARLDSPCHGIAPCLALHFSSISLPHGYEFFRLSHFFQCSRLSTCK